LWLTEIIIFALYPVLYSALYTFVSTPPHPSVRDVCPNRIESGTMTQTSRAPHSNPLLGVGNTTPSSMSALSRQSRKDKY